MATNGSHQAPASRLPSTRESRPALIGLALLLIIGGALASAYLALVAGDRADFVQVDREITQGVAITEDDLTTVSLPEGYTGGIPAGEIDDLVGQSTTVRLLPGTVLTPEMVSDEGGIPDGEVQVSLLLERATAAALTSGAPLTLYVEGGQDESGVEVPAELVSVAAGDDGGLADSSADEVPIVVQFDSACNRTVSQGKIDGSVSVSVGTSSNARPAECAR